MKRNKNGDNNKNEVKVVAMRIVYTYLECNSKLWWSHGHGCPNHLHELQHFGRGLGKYWEYEQLYLWRFHNTSQQVHLFLIHSQTFQQETWFLTRDSFIESAHTQQSLCFMSLFIHITHQLFYYFILFFFPLQILL